MLCSQKKTAFIGPKLGLFSRKCGQKRVKKDGTYRGKTRLYSKVYAVQSGSEKTTFIGAKVGLTKEYTQFEAILKNGFYRAETGPFHQNTTVLKCVFTKSLLLPQFYITTNSN